MKNNKFSNVFFVVLAFFALVVGLGTGCGGGGGGGGDSANTPPADDTVTPVPGDGEDPDAGEPPAEPETQPGS